MVQGMTDTARPSTLTPQQEAYALARAAGKNGKEAAEIAGIAERTSWEYNANPAIQARIDELQRPIKDAVLSHFRGHAMRAAERITGLIESGTGGPAGDLNLRASLAVLKFVDVEPPARQKVTVEDGTLTDEQRAERIAQLLDAARARRAGPPAGDE